MRRIILVGLAGAMLGACVGGDNGLRRFNDGEGPDEFSVQPAQPLVIPGELSLPVPGGANRADADPSDQAILALGGSPAEQSAGGVPTGDAAIVSYVSRNGVPADIRATVAAEDQAFRDRNRARTFFNWLGRDRYFQAYSGQALDAFAELSRFRAAGVEVPTAPPAP